MTPLWLLASAAAQAAAGPQSLSEANAEAMSEAEVEHKMSAMSSEASLAMSFGLDPEDIDDRPSQPTSVLESRGKSLSGVGPEIPLPLYYSTPDSVLAVGPEGQVEHVSPDQLTPGQVELLHAISGNFFDNTGHLPMQTVIGICTQGKNQKNQHDVQSCVATLSAMTPTHMKGMKDLILQSGSMNKKRESNDVLSLLDRGKTMLPSGHQDPTTANGGPQNNAAECEYFVPNLVEPCKIVMSASQKKQDGGSKCPRMEIDNVGFYTSEYGHALDRLAPFYSQQKHFHYFDEERQLRKKYDVRSSTHGCGVVATQDIQRGDLIGLAAVAHAQYIQGLMIALQETPWLGTNMNHCPTLSEFEEVGGQETDLGAEKIENGANTILKLVEEDQKPASLWVYATRHIHPGEEITMDYDAAHNKYPNFIQSAQADWSCPTQKFAKKEKELRRVTEEDAERVRMR